jgi:Ca2+/Na+ antiporter
MANASWGMLQELWNTGIGALFGTNLLIIGGFFMIFTVFIIQRLGLSTELAIPFGMVMVFVLAIINPGLLPGWAWTAGLFLAAVLVFVAIRNVTRGY